jgi:hypothetical protein
MYSPQELGKNASSAITLLEHVGWDQALLAIQLKLQFSLQPTAPFLYHWLAMEYQLLLCTPMAHALV